MAPDPALQPLSDDQRTCSAIAGRLRDRADRPRAAASAEALPMAALRFEAHVCAALTTISGGLKTHAQAQGCEQLTARYSENASCVWRILARREIENLPLMQPANSREAGLAEENQSWMAGIDDQKDASAEGWLALGAVCANGTED